MSLADRIKVNTHYTRSINLERDRDSVAAVRAYIPTSRAIRTLVRVTEVFHEGQAPRAWSLVGPYGSGKSAFSLFLSKLLSGSIDPANGEAIRLLSASDKALGAKFKKHLGPDGGYLQVLVTGSPEPMYGRIAKALHAGAVSFWSGRPGRNPSVIGGLERASREGASGSELIALIEELQQQVGRAGGKGVLIVIDELGKFLEYEARHYGANDIYLLQSLAEHACKGADANLFLFVLLHQSFEQYAKGLGENLKNEWSKVQGRFEDVPFLESAEQVLRVVSAAFEHDFSPSEWRKIKADIGSVVGALLDTKALPGALSREEAAELFASCYPLHPVAAVLLPLLCQKVAQNERTLFSYLGSHEEHGFHSLLSKMDGASSYVLPEHIFDYFIANQSSAMGDYLVHRRWAEVVTAIDRLGDATESEVAVLKTIGVLNIVGAKGGFKASKDILGSVFPAASLSRALKLLKDKGIVNFRKFNSEYRVWQGSDFDLEAAIDEESANLGNFRLAEELNKSAPLLPVVARRYTIESGALRYFDPVFVDAQDYVKSLERGEVPRIIFFLATGQDDERLFYSHVAARFSELDIVVLCLIGNQIREAVAERQALERVGSGRQELNTDPVARREFDDRLAAAQQAEAGILMRLLDEPSASVWLNAGKRLEVGSKRQLQQAMSLVLASVFSKSPIFHNELINRDRPSSQANAARNKLLAAMIESADKPDLLIEKYPPEKAIYKALLKNSGLHAEVNGVWGFSEPSFDGRSDRLHVRHAWKKIIEFLDGTEKTPASFADLNSILMAPPYGLKAGVLPILYVTVYLVYQHELALYESGQYRPYLTPDMVERFVKRPDDYAVQRFKIVGMRASIFEQYSRVVHGDTKKRSILELAKPLAGFMGGLPEYTRKTRRGVSADAQRVRTAFELAKSPERLLFEGLPGALGFGDIASGAGEQNLDVFAEKLTAALRELKNAHQSLCESFKALVAQAFNHDPNMSLADIRRVVSGECHGLEDFTIDTQGLKAFLMRISRGTGSDQEWLDNLMMFLGHKPSEKWLDSDQDLAEQRLADFSRRVIDLEKLRLHAKDRAAHIQGDFDVYLVRSVKKGGAFRDEVVAIDPKTSERLRDVREKVNEALGLLGKDKELKLALLAEYIDSFLEDYQQSDRTAAGKDMTTVDRKPRRKS